MPDQPARLGQKTTWLSQNGEADSGSHAPTNGAGFRSGAGLAATIANGEGTDAVASHGKAYALASLQSVLRTVRNRCTAQ